MEINRENIVIHTPFIKLDALLKFSGLAESGAMAKEFIAGGFVSVNGQPELQRGKKLHPGDVVRIELPGNGCEELLIKEGDADSGHGTGDVF